MCVTVAMKLPRNRETGKAEKDAKWCLFKIRDRAYVPVYNFKKYDNGNSTSLFLVDEDTDWSECIRVNDKTGETELMFVNSALNNTVDYKEGNSDKNKGKTKDVKTADHGRIARRITKQNNLKEAIDYLTEFKFDGCTFVSDGKKCFLIESSLPADFKKQTKKQKGQKFREFATSEDFVTTVEEITDEIAVRTNHGITNKNSGYQVKDGLSYQSSSKRREYAEKYIKENIFSVDDIVETIDFLGSEEIDKHPFLRPRRIKSEIEKLMKKDKTFKSHIFSTSCFVMTAYGRLIVKLYDAEIGKLNIKTIFNNEFPIKVTIMR